MRAFELEYYIIEDRDDGRDYGGDDGRDYGWDDGGPRADPGPATGAYGPEAHGGAGSYGVEILKRSPGIELGTEVAAYHGITDSREAAAGIVALLARCTVTPTTLGCVLEDMLV
ncbi:MAG: DUF6514 family protein [Oscillospiraceae bacterium]|nr:DUF6514 family protein [Oscillospiraceae bacterium]